MARLNSFYLAPADWREPFCLDGEEAHHLTRVLRTRIGDTVRLFDGQGRWGLFRVREAAKKNVQLTCLSTQSAAAHPALTLAVGWCKGLRRGFLLEKAVELGAGAIWFWPAARSQGDMPDQGQETWRKQMIAAAKQCGATWLPQVMVLESPLAVAARGARFDRRVLCWEQEQSRIIEPRDLIHDQGALAVLGPEGGLDNNEAEIFTDNGFPAVSLGPHIMRFETAAFFVLTLARWAAIQTMGRQCPDPDRRSQS